MPGGTTGLESKGKGEVRQSQEKSAESHTAVKQQWIFGRLVGTLSGSHSITQVISTNVITTSMSKHVYLQYKNAFMWY
jgi:hypothetical protein